jgi:hypothetical protein
MTSEYPYDAKQDQKETEMRASPSRLTDEKISNETDTESLSDSALKPAGLNNPFWN